MARRRFGRRGAGVGFGARLRAGRGMDRSRRGIRPPRFWLFCKLPQRLRAVHRTGLWQHLPYLKGEVLSDAQPQRPCPMLSDVVSDGRDLRSRRDCPMLSDALGRWFAR